MQPSIRELKPTEHMLGTMAAVAGSAFGAEYSQLQIERNWKLSHQDSTFFGAFVDEELVAFVGFLAHSGFGARNGNLNGVKLFQACHVSTKEEFKGRGLFSKIVEHALRNLAGDFVIGFPNSIAEPIWLNRFKFKLTPLRRIWMNLSTPHLFFAFRKLEPARKHKGLIGANEREVAFWKNRERAGEVISIENSGNFIWGRILEKQAGFLKVKYFGVGGVSVGDPMKLADAFLALREACDVHLAQIICTETSPLCSAARFSLHGRRTEPLIWFPLRGSDPDVEFDISIGIKDVF